jgi:hypothetical protein
MASRSSRGVSNWAIEVRQPRAVSLKAGITAGSTMVAGETFKSLVQESNAIAIKSCSVAASSSSQESAAALGPFRRFRTIASYGVFTTTTAASFRRRKGSVNGAS